MPPSIRLEDLLTATGGHLIGPTTISSFQGAAVDSRHVTPGCCFVALRGERVDRHAYVEETEGGEATYTEHHRTVGDLVRAVAASGLRLLDLVEPAWPEGGDHVWGGWSRLRGELIPGTLVLVCVKG